MPHEHLAYLGGVSFTEVWQFEIEYGHTCEKRIFAAKITDDEGRIDVSNRCNIAHSCTLIAFPSEQFLGGPQDSVSGTV